MENQKTTHFNLERLKEIAIPRSPKSIMLCTERARNRGKFILSAHIALYIRWVLKERNISEKEFANMLNLSPSIATSYLSGQRNFTIKEIANLEEKLNIKIIRDDLI